MTASILFAFSSLVSILTVDAGAGSWYTFEIREEGEIGYFANCKNLCAFLDGSPACLSSHHSSGSYPDILDGLYDSSDTHDFPLKFVEHFTYSVAANNKPVSVKTNWLTVSPPQISLDVSIPQTVNPALACDVNFDPIEPDESFVYMRLGVCCCGVAAGPLTGCEWKASVPEENNSGSFSAVYTIMAILLAMGSAGILFITIPIIHRIIRRNQQAYSSEI